MKKSVGLVLFGILVASIFSSFYVSAWMWSGFDAGDCGLYKVVCDASGGGGTHSFVGARVRSAGMCGGPNSWTSHDQNCAQSDICFDQLHYSCIPGCPGSQACGGSLPDVSQGGSSSSTTTGSCTAGTGYEYITTQSCSSHEACCVLVQNCGPSAWNCGNDCSGSSCFGCPPPYSGTIGGSVGYYPNHGTCVTVSDGCTSSTSYYCSGTNCGQQCSPNSAAGCASSCSSLNQTYWADVNGAKIDATGLGSTVLMVAPGGNLNNQLINFTIKKQGDLSWNPLNWFTRTILQKSDLGISDWKTYQIGDFFFNAKVANVQNNSNILGVSGNYNAMPTTSILASDNIFGIVGDNIAFAHNSSDKDDLLKIFWDFGDGTTATFYNYSSYLTPYLGNLWHNYTSNGTYTVRITATEMDRGQSATDTKTVRILQTGGYMNIIPVINSPSSDGVYGNWVTFNISGTYIINCTAGFVPGMIADYVIIGTNRNISCKYVVPAYSKIIPAPYDILVNWTVYSGGRFAFSRAGRWNSNYSNLVEFVHFFDVPARHTANVTIDFIRN